jgi:NADH-quinone oxidoreductase subunit C
MSQRDTAWGPMEVQRVAASEAAQALQAVGIELKLCVPNLPWVAPEGEAKDLVRRAKEEDAEPVWRGDAYLLLSEPGQVTQALQHCRDELGYSQLYDLTACDPAADETQLKLIYGLRNLKSKARLILQSRVDKAAASVPSVASIYQAADWHEREAGEMYGITFVGHPDPRNILLPDDWVGFPLRKDYEYPDEYNGVSCKE